jgi:tetratricopeptide (TPR) repeat protein
MDWKVYSGQRQQSLFGRTVCLVERAVRRKITQLGLLNERAGRFGFRDLASARQIAKLLADGVRPREIISSVNEIRKGLPDTGLGSVRLHPGPYDSLKVEQARGRTDEHGQFVLSVDDCRLDPAFAEAWYHLVDLLDDLGRSEAVIECLRKSLQVAPEYVDAIFNLGSAAATKK